MGVISSFGSAPGLPMIDTSNCTVCAACAEICPTGVLSKHNGGIRIDNTVTFGCIACGHCMMVCPSGSISVSGRNLSPGDLQALPPRDHLPGAEQVEALLLSRRSVRHFKNDEVPAQLLDRVVAAAATAPMGIPPWEVGVVVFGGRTQVQALATDAADTYAGMLRFMDHSMVMSLMRPFMKKAGHDQFRSFIIPLGRTIVEGRRAGEDKVRASVPNRRSLSAMGSPLCRAGMSAFSRGRRSCSDWIPPPRVCWNPSSFPNDQDPHYLGISHPGSNRYRSAGARFISEEALWRRDIGATGPRIAGLAIIPLASGAERKIELGYGIPGTGAYFRSHRHAPRNIPIENRRLSRIPLLFLRFKGP